MLSLSSLSFDMCVYEVFGSLAAGGAIVMPEQCALREPARCNRSIGVSPCSGPRIGNFAKRWQSRSWTKALERTRVQA